MPSSREDSSFAELMKDQVEEIKISTSALDHAIDWIAGNLNPDEVFSKSDLEEWAESNGYIKE
jgi:hypothetical protein